MAQEEKKVETKKSNKFVDFFKKIPWSKSIKPVIGYSVLGGVTAFAVLLILVCCL